MKRFSTLLTAAAVIFSVQVIAQEPTPPPSYTETFEGGSVASCVPLTNVYTTTAAGEVINGTGSLYSNPPVNGSGTRDYMSPYLNITSTDLTISYWYKLNETLNGAATRTIEIGLISASGVYTTLNTFTIDKNTPNQLTSKQNIFSTLTAPGTGLYRLVVKLGGDKGNGTARTIMDDISINANPYYQNICNQASTLSNDAYMGTTGQPFASTVSVLSNDGADPEGEARTISISQPSLDGTVALSPDGNFTFTPNAGFIGTSTTFQYQVCDNGFPSMCATATVTINFVDNISLPIKLMSFAGSINSNKAQLRWSVADNETGYQFQVLRSSDARTFTEAGTVFISNKPGAESYTFNDSRELDAVTYYKLKIINKDGSVSYSNVIALKNASTKPSTGIHMMQNPVESTLTFTYSATTASQGQLAIYNTLGVKVYSQRIASQKGTNSVSLNLDSHLAAGTYILEVVNGADRATTRMIKR